MNVLVVGSGGREHALVWKLKQSPKIQNIFCAPGNGGIQELAQCVDVNADDVVGLCNFAKENNIDLTVVGPEIPLVLGIVDYFEEKGLRIFGPNRKAAQLEGSKVFAKEFMKKYEIPTANSKSFVDIGEALTFLDDRIFPVVVKADGLAAGKGVIICQDKEEAEKALNDIMCQKVFKEAGNRVIIEDCLAGEEASILAISDGDHFVVLDSSQDHKRIFDDDLGPNTGGMGAYSPAPVITKEKMVDIALNVIGPTIQGMKEEGAKFKGVLYVGLMMTLDGPMVLEYNVRFGDPETQAVLPRLKTDLLDVFLSACDEKLSEIKLEWDRGACVCVVMSSRGYPGPYEKNKVIEGLKSADECADTVVFHAGTKNEKDQIITSGGRVLGVTSIGNDVEQAMVKAYNVVEKIKFEGCFFRRDIGAKALRYKEELSEKRI